MHFRQSALSVQAKGSEKRAVASETPQADASLPADVNAPRPFVERRRSRRAERSWPEALDSLQSILLGYENATKDLIEAETRYRTIFEDAPVGMFQLDPDGRPVRVNNAMARILGYASSEEFLAEALQSSQEVEFFDAIQWDSNSSCREEADVRSFDREIDGHDGKTRWIRIHIREIRENETIVRYEGAGEDITDRKQKELETERLAYYDSLTGLPNQMLFNDRLGKSLAAAHRKDGQTALILLELDRFKTLNDSLGDRVGDRLLQEISSRILEAAGEKSVVARTGGAEFAIILQEVEDFKSVTDVAERVLAKLGEEYSLFEHSLNVFCNLGISLFPKNGKDSETIVKSADVAMSCSKESGPNTFCIFTDEMNNKIQESRRIEHGLRSALNRNELYLDYQPQVDARTGRITGLEALLRWNHPQSGLIPPGKFIDVAEGSGLIVPIGEWVLRTACAQARKWQDAGLPPVPIAVNVSAIQFRQQGFHELIRNVLDETGLNPKYLELELTESLLLSNADVMFSMLQELKDMGVMLAIDDFGTGYSSLGYLRQFKVNRLKIARSFIKDVSVDADDAAITTAIINMAKALNLSVLAEGVENEEQLSFLERQECYTIQGFYFSRPVSVDQIDAHLRAGFGHLTTPSHNNVSA
jgi:diguanylate cyclase (GGDEF)-like protein/PAS domain S-box-containing protein